MHVESKGNLYVCARNAYVHEQCTFFSPAPELVPFLYNRSGMRAKRSGINPFQQN
jgi:hypothetical protein